MPTLPSGRQVAISSSPAHMPVTAQYACPEGHFWYWTPDLAINPPPYGPDQKDLAIQLVHAPVPESREEAARYVRVMYYEPDGSYYWPGEWLAEFKQPESWDDADWAAWQDWLGTPRVGEYLDRVIETCRAKSEGKPGAGQLALIEGSPTPKESEQERCLERRAYVIQGRVLDLAKRMRVARDNLDDVVLDELERDMRSQAERLDTLLAESDEPNPGLWYLRSLAHGAFGEWAQAERCCSRVLRRMPFASKAWIQLSIARGRQEKYVEAEEAARRALEITDAATPDAWLLLAAALGGQSRHGEARAAMARARRLQASGRGEGASEAHQAEPTVH